MSEYEQNGLILADSIPTQDKESLLSGLRENRKKAYSKEITEIESRRFLPYASHLFQLDDLRREQLSAIIARVGSKLQECGVDNAERLLPSEERFIIVEPNFLCEDDWPISGAYHPNGDYIRIDLSPTRKLEDLKTQFVIIHEISHATPYKVYQLDKTKKHLECQALGFMTARGVNSSTGVVWEEPMANLFALFCIDSDMEFKLPHCYETVFSIAMIDRISRLQDGPPLEIFKRLMRAKTVRDFSIQMELEDVLGKNAVRLMNHTRYIGWTGDVETYEKAAQSGNFFEVYAGLYKSIKDRQTIKVSEFIPGIKGTIESM